MSIWGDFPVGFGVWECVESIGNGCGIQMDGFSAREVPYSFIFDEFHDLCHFGVVFGGLTLIPRGPELPENILKLPGGVLVLPEAVLRVPQPVLRLPKAVPRLS